MYISSVLFAGDSHPDTGSQASFFFSFLTETKTHIVLFLLYILPLMSQMNIFDDLEDEWDDFTPSLQDQLFENLEAESHASANEYNVCTLCTLIIRY
jgi:hypothetical protein